MFFVSCSQLPRTLSCSPITEPLLAVLGCALPRRCACKGLCLGRARHVLVCELLPYSHSDRQTTSFIGFPTEAGIQIDSIIINSIRAQRLPGDKLLHIPDARQKCRINKKVDI